MVIQADISTLYYILFFDLFIVFNNLYTKQFPSDKI